ncbi:MAG: hypothetical protein CMH98_00120, partial [Oceanospirillaceae bacterium]|nr:hypothetical protein [Oceanospirillaceae bacterium]
MTPLFQSSVIETPVSLFRMKVTSQSADAKRASFVWRAPATRLLLNPLVYYEAEFFVTVPNKFSKAYNMASVQQPSDAVNVGAGVDDGVGYGVVGTAASGNRIAKSDGMCITLGEGNPIMNSCESIQYTINGMSISHQNFHLFKRSMDRTEIPSNVAQRCFARCGGAWNNYDERCTSSSLAQRTSLTARGGLAATAVDLAADVDAGCTQAAGMTCDSGTAQRARNFADCIVSAVGAAGNNGVDYSDGYKYKIKVLAPLDGGLFNQVYGEAGLSQSGVYPKLALAIPNANSMAVTILWKDLEKQLVRRLGRTFLGVNAGANSIAAQHERTTVPFKVEFAGTEAYLHLKYLRMQAFRSYPEAISLACYRHQTYIQNMVVGDGVITDPAANDIAYSEGFKGPYLLPSGPDIRPNAQIPLRGAAYGFADKERVWNCNFQNCVYSQPPSFLFFVAQKSMDCVQFVSPNSRTNVDDLTQQAAVIAGDVIPDTNTADAAAKIKSQYRSVIQNQDANLSIVRFKLLVQSSLASWELTSDKFPYLLDQQQLWDVHKKNCHTQYLKDAGIDEWSRRACCLKLSCADYLAGLGASFGTAFPITISCEIVFANKSAFVTGLKYSDVRSPGPILFQEPIHARAVMTGVF